VNGPPGHLFSESNVAETANAGNLEAADADADEVLKQALSLYRRTRALHRELQLAELALGKDSSEANLGRLKDIQAQSSALGGIEAAAEGFGAQSGRPSGTL
jgi:DNA primase